MRLIIWRFSNYEDLSGRGGLAASGRWHTRGQLVVYCADEPATAMAEVLQKVSGAAELVPTNYAMLEIDVPPGPVVEVVDEASLPPGWSGSVVRGWPVCQPTGDAWLAAVRTPLLKVPSAARRGAWNYLINPLHMDARFIRVVRVLRHPATLAYLP